MVRRDADVLHACVCCGCWCAGGRCCWRVVCLVVGAMLLVVVGDCVGVSVAVLVAVCLSAMALSLMCGFRWCVSIVVV